MANGWLEPLYLQVETAHYPSNNMLGRSYESLNTAVTRENSLPLPEVKLCLSEPIPNHSVDYEVYCTLLRITSTYSQIYEQSSKF